MPDVKLTFINRSNDRNNSDVVIFQRNEAPSYEDLAVAWKVIQNCGQGWTHPFTYPMNSYLAAGDSWGNFSPQKLATNGQQFKVASDTSGDDIQYSGPSTNPNAIELLNGLEQGAINAYVYKDGRVIAMKTSIDPEQLAIFQFKPTLWIGVASQVEEGDVLNAAIMTSINTEIALLGIASADIVMTGGGPGADSKPFEFALQNVKYA